MRKERKFSFKKAAMALALTTMVGGSLLPHSSLAASTKATTDSPSIYYSHTLTNVQHAWDNGITGKGVKIAIIDSGVYLKNTDLQVAGGASFVGNMQSYDDDNGHGTAVAGVISALNNGRGPTGVAYDSEIYAVKVSKEIGFSNPSDIAKGVQWAVDQNMDIINISVGVTGDYPALRKAIENAEKKGILVVAAAGNEGSSVVYPAKYDNVIAVGAIDHNKIATTWSNKGPEIDLVAPGVGIGTTASGGFGITNGTSVSAPYVTGMLALYKQAFPHMSASELKNALYQNALDLGAKGKDNMYGYGLVQFPMIASIKEEKPSTPIEAAPTVKQPETKQTTVKQPTAKPKEEPKKAQSKPDESIINLDNIVAINTKTKHFGWQPIKGAKRYRLSLERLTNNPKSLGSKLLTDTKYDLTRMKLQNNNKYVLTITPHINGKYDAKKTIKVKIAIKGNAYDIAFYDSKK